MSEPTNPEHYYIYVGRIEVDGKKGYGKVKKWFSKEEGKVLERVLDFEEDV